MVGLDIGGCGRSIASTTDVLWCDDEYNGNFLWKWRNEDGDADVSRKWLKVDVNVIYWHNNMYLGWHNLFRTRWSRFTCFKAKGFYFEF